MPYRFKGEEAVQDAFRRCAREQLDEAIHQLTEGVESDPVAGVHTARKALKKERSLLRLARSSMSARERRRENGSLRDAGRRLSGARDAAVMVQALHELHERYAGQVPKPTFDAIRARLSATSQPDTAATGDVAAELEAARSRIGGWHLRTGGWPAIGGGLKLSYKRGRRAFRRAKAEPTIENLHEWRKRAKDLWYHTRLLDSLSPHTVRGHAKDAHVLADRLGDDHDLAVLRESLVAARGELALDLDPVLVLIDHRRSRLEAEAMLLGERIYAESPKAFRRRFHCYWTAWRAEVRREQAEHPAELARRTREPAAT